ncbi:atrial natriuretic peptide receptor 1-like [Mercenaria mercenaria]|uniref:atrial natriuretic peptide receptor 1-like n=1 Tax=Mercenaria mercenaria TaxID=6596 RepID=UPI00234ED7E2|nr:atrial natriuretic peptide receptor 1-like [Mercenaria mercenaria]
MSFHLCNFIVVATVLARPCCFMEIRLGVILPEVSSYPWSIMHVMPAIEMAVESVQRDILPEHRVFTYVKDSECSATMGPLAAMDLHKDKHVHVLFGPVCPYAVAPVARFSPHWNVPLITAGASAYDFDYKSEFKLLTRVHETFSKEADAIIQLASKFNWKHFGLLYQKYRRSAPGYSDCFHRISAIHLKIKETFPWYEIFVRILHSSYTDFDRILNSASQNARIIVMCGSPDSVRELMITANELGYDNGEYVFLNIDSGESENNFELPWYREEDTMERNNKARKAYEALMRISLLKQKSLEYSSFSNEVKLRAKLRYENFTSYEGEVNSYVGAFHDAVVLYALALNETIEADESVTDGSAVTRRMWNKTFNGITGSVVIDENGDRIMDYSLLDMDPSTGRFQVVVNYIGQSKELVPLPDRRIHWGNEYDSAPPDTPSCGFDNSKCENNGESTDTSTSKSSSRRKVEDMLESLQLTLSKITEAVQGHNASLVAMTKLVKEEARFDGDS